MFKVRGWAKLKVRHLSSGLLYSLGTSYHSPMDKYGFAKLSEVRPKDERVKRERERNSLSRSWTASDGGRKREGRAQWLWASLSEYDRFKS